MVTVPEILAAMATKIATVDGVQAAHYPPPKTLMRGPEVVLYWGSDLDTDLESRPRHRMWLAKVKAQVLIAMEGNTPAEFGVIDNLITPIVSCFAPGHTADSLPGLPATGHVDHVIPRRIRPTLMVTYAGHDYYGAEIFFDIKFHDNGGTP